MPRPSLRSTRNKSGASRSSARTLEMQPTEERKHLPPDLDPGEAELLEGWGKHLEHRFPNPDRIGCPGARVLKGIARDSKNFHNRKILDHIARCAPCSNELLQLLDTTGRS
jgi:hypothetical protein